MDQGRLRGKTARFKTAESPEAVLPYDPEEKRRAIALLLMQELRVEKLGVDNTLSQLSGPEELRRFSQPPGGGAPAVVHGGAPDSGSYLDALGGRSPLGDFSPPHAPVVPGGLLTPPPPSKKRGWLVGCLVVIGIALTLMIVAGLLWWLQNLIPWHALWLITINVIAFVITFFVARMLWRRGWRKLAVVGQILEIVTVATLVWWLQNVI